MKVFPRIIADWRVWKAHKDSLREQGISCNKYLDVWYVNFWDESAEEDVVSFDPTNRIDKSFAILALSDGVSYVEARHRYLELAKVLHPDKASGDIDKFQELQSAWDFLVGLYKYREEL